MSEEQLKTFLEKATGDASIQDKLKAAADIDSVVAIAKEAGFSIFAEELKKAQSELSFEELEGVAGGDFFWRSMLPGSNFRKEQAKLTTRYKLAHSQSTCICRGFYFFN